MVLGIIVTSVVVTLVLYAIRPVLPWLGVGYLVLLSGLMFYDCIQKRRMEKQIGILASVPKSGVEEEFHGMLMLGFETSSVTVATGRRRFFIWPVFEEWYAVSSAHFNWNVLPQDPASSDGGGCWFIRFVGTPSDIGRYGHMGHCRREIHIIKILAAQLWRS